MTEETEHKFLLLKKRRKKYVMFFLLKFLTGILLVPIMFILFFYYPVLFASDNSLNMLFLPFYAVLITLEILFWVWFFRACATFGYPRSAMVLLLFASLFFPLAFLIALAVIDHKIHKSIKAFEMGTGIPPLRE